MAQKCTLKLKYIWIKVHLFDLLTFFFFSLRTSQYGKSPADTYFTLQCLTKVHINPVLVFKLTPYLFYAGFPESTPGTNRERNWPCFPGHEGEWRGSNGSVLQRLNSPQDAPPLMMLCLTEIFHRHI